MGSTLPMVAPPLFKNNTKLLKFVRTRIENEYIEREMKEGTKDSSRELCDLSFESFFV